MKSLFTSTLISLLILSISVSFSQQKSSGIVQTDNNPGQTFTKFTNDKTLSAKDQDLINQIIEIKNSGDASRQGKLKRLLKEFNHNNGFIERPGENYKGRVFSYPQTGLNKIESLTDSVFGGLVKSFGTAAEQTGTDKGKAWVVYTHGNASGGDTLEIYSTTGAGEYILRGAAILSSTDIFFPGNLDVEIVEKKSGEKILYAFYTYGTVNTGIGRIGGVALDINSGVISIFGLYWPGAAATNKYYNVHITSDNSVDSTTTWIYIACSMDSVGAGGNWFYGQKFAYIYQTTAVPTFTYRPNVLPVYWQSGDNSSRYLITDIAYFRDESNSPSLMFTYSNIPDSTKIWLTKSYFNGTNAVFYGTLGSTSQIFYSSIASTGGLNNPTLMIVATQNWFNGGDWDLVSYKTTDGGSNWAQTFIDGFTSTSTRLPSSPDIYAKWKDYDNYRVSYSLCYSFIWPADSVMYIESVTSSDNQWQTPERIDDPDVSQPNLISKVGFFGNNSDDCFVLWTSYYSGGLFASYCAQPSGISDNRTILSDYSLSYNYPNPFNPATNIEYQIPKSSYVTIKIYDILGNELEILVSGEKPAGTYELIWDGAIYPTGVYFYQLKAGSFTETRKMLLLR